jgi:hypothetical protein
MMKSTTNGHEQRSTLVSTKSATPYRQIRALYDSDTITVYQAYNAEIASQAVEHQKLNASPLFKSSRMTWIKPSWCWMMYRAGYSFKDKNQEHILALKMTHEDFLGLLEKGVLTTEPAKSQSSGNGYEYGPTDGNNRLKQKPADVKIQWDPERSPRLGRLDYRSIQIGIPGALQTEWAEKWIASIEDVTETAQGLKRILDESPEVTDQELLTKGLLPEEREFKVPERLQSVLEMG